MSCVLDWTKAVLCLVCRNKLQLYFVLQLYYFFGVEINYSCTLSCVLTELQLYYVLCVGLKYSTAELCFVCWLNYYYYIGMSCMYVTITGCLRGRFTFPWHIGVLDCELEFSKKLLIRKYQNLDNKTFLGFLQKSWILNRVHFRLT